MNSEGRNVGLAIVMCVLFYLGYNSYLTKKYPKPEAGRTATDTPAAVAPSGDDSSQTQPAAIGTTSGTASESKLTAPAATITRLAENDLVFENESAIITFNQDYSAINSVLLKDYRAARERNSGSVELLSSMMTIQGTPTLTKTEPTVGYHAQRQGNSIAFWTTDGPWKIEQLFTIPSSGFGAQLKVTFHNISDRSQDLEANLAVTQNISEAKKASSSFFIPDFVTQQSSFISGISGSREAVLVSEYCGDGNHSEPALEGRSIDLDYAGFDSHYFLTAILPKTKNLSYSMRYRGGRSGDGCPMLLTTSQPHGQVAPGSSSSMDFEIYFGPKEVHALTNFDERLKSSIDLGWFGVIAHPLLLAVQGLYRAFGNYGIAIIIITILLKILFYPLTKASVISMKKMQKLQPQMAALRETHKEDPRRQQQELMKFMQTHKINPAKGCLPILPQIPVFIAFYNVLSHAIELRHAPFFGWIQDLSVADPYYITPILLGVGMFIQQKLTPNPSMDKNQEKIMLMMPVIFTVMMLSLPAGMVLYMIVNTVVTILQQQWLNRRIAV